MGRQLSFKLVATSFHTLVCWRQEFHSGLGFYPLVLAPWLLVHLEGCQATGLVAVTVFLHSSLLPRAITALVSQHVQNVTT